MEQKIVIRERCLREPFYADKWESAKIYDIPKEGFSGNWKVLNPEEDSLAQKYAVYPANFPRIYKSDTPGDSYTVRFKGTTIGFYDITGPDSGQLSVTVDGKPAVIYDRFGPLRDFQKQTYFYIDEIEDGFHRVTFTVHNEISNKYTILVDEKKQDFIQNLEKYKGNVIYLGLIIVVGELV